MRARFRDLATASLWALGIACLAPTPADAQSAVAGDSLGGYGAPSGIGGMGTGGGGAMVIPYGGMTEGFMPGRMGGGSSLSFRARSTATMGPSRAPLSLSPLSGGMGRGIGARSSMSSPTGLRGMGPGGNSSRFGSGGAGMGVMPPRIGYPFRQPPSLLTPSSGFPGMSM